MTVKVTPLPAKTNPNPDRPIDADANNKFPMFMFFFLIMMPNTIGSFARAYLRNDKDYVFAVFGLLVFSVFVLVDCCQVKYFALPKNEKSSRKIWLKVTLWFLYTGNSFGLMYLLSYFIRSQIIVAMCAVVFIGSAVLLYAFVIRDIVGDWRSQTVDVGKSNHAYSVLEKV